MLALRHLHLQLTDHTITWPTVICRIHHHWTSRTHPPFRPIRTWATLTCRRHRLFRQTALCCAIRGVPCRRLTCCTTRAKTRRYCKRRRSPKNENLAASVTVMVLTNRKDILFETRRTFCMCFKMCTNVRVLRAVERERWWFSTKDCYTDIYSMYVNYLANSYNC